MKPRVYIDDYNGITAHLETLTMAFAIRKAYGHEIALDWRELDALEIKETIQRRVTILTKIGAVRLRHSCDKHTFQTLKGKKIICRSEDGPAEILDPIYLEVAKKVKIKRDVVDKIVRIFNAIQDRPIVGLQIRRGDFSLASEHVYDPTLTEWPAVPLWWYEKVMNALLKNQKELKFFLSASGDPASYAALRRNFDILTLDIPSPYHWKGPGHQSEIHPVADLFALACCPLILATPVSNFSHWAANVLGYPSTTLIPLKGACPDKPLTGILSLYGQRLSVWRKVCRSENSELVKKFDFENPLQSTPSRTDWLETAKASF
ncbi:MAG TPA: hypothetical protein DCP92_25260 [Nitrospiraceae bacterium]|jgi:hypothetical protein|nr:hypothetical protein [Nitrospiraceae bacterium]